MVSSGLAELVRCDPVLRYSDSVFYRREDWVYEGVSTVAARSGMYPETEASPVSETLYTGTIQEKGSLG
jgi:hypothetical protein